MRVAPHVYDGADRHCRGDTLGVNVSAARPPPPPPPSPTSPRAHGPSPCYRPNAARKGATIHNDSTQILYVKFGTTASATSYTVKMVADAYYEVPFGYTGRIDGIWASANGNARVDGDDLMPLSRRPPAREHRRPRTTRRYRLTGDTLRRDRGSAPSPGGELGGTWASPTVDATHAGGTHHTQAHVVTGADHTASGLTIGHVLTASSSTAFGFAAPAAPVLTSASAFATAETTLSRPPPTPTSPAASVSLAAGYVDGLRPCRGARRRERPHTRGVVATLTTTNGHQ